MLNVESGVPTSWSSPTVDAEVNEERDPKRMRLEQLFSDFNIPSFREIDYELQFELQEVLPSMAETYKNSDWFLLQKYSSTGSSLNIEHALKSEFAAISVWFLFSEVPLHIKEGAARVLTCLSFGTSEAPNVSNQESVEILVLRVLCGGGEGSTPVEVQRQVCLAISFLASCSRSCLVLRFGPAIEDRLLQLIRDPCCSSKLTFPLISAIVNIAIVNNVMREKILDTELFDSWLGKLMDTAHDSSILEKACLAVACIASYACGKGYEALWDHFKSQFMPAIVNKCCLGCHRDLTRAAASAISKITKYAASSPDKIKDLVRGGCLEVLFHMNRIYDDEILRPCLAAIKIILRAGDVVKGRRRQRPKYNEYAKLIDDFDRGWDRLNADEDYYDFEIVNEARDILLEYRPRVWWGDHWQSDESDLESWDDDDDDDDDDDEMSEDEADLEA